jgi:probable phosphoglycerate mutase
MLTYLVRHAPTEYSLGYRVNGDPSTDVPLVTDAVTRCARSRRALPDSGIATWIASPFRRCVRTAILLGGRGRTVIEPGLAELDYGVYEGGPFTDYAGWLSAHGRDAVPPGSRESQAEGITRMLTGVRNALQRPGPRLVVAHGLLPSVVRWALDHPGEPLTEIFLPEAPYLVPLTVDDVQLADLIDLLARPTTVSR